MLLGLFCYIQTEKIAFRQTDMMPVGNLTKQSEVEEEERPGKREGGEIKHSLSILPQKTARNYNPNKDVWRKTQPNFQLQPYFHQS